MHRTSRGLFGPSLDIRHLICAWAATLRATWWPSSRQARPLISKPGFEQCATREGLKSLSGTYAGHVESALERELHVAARASRRLRTDPRLMPPADAGSSGSSSHPGSTRSGSTERSCEARPSPTGLLPSQGRSAQTSSAPDARAASTPAHRACGPGRPPFSPINGHKQHRLVQTYPRLVIAIGLSMTSVNSPCAPMRARFGRATARSKSA